MISAVEAIQTKRDRGELSREAIDAFVAAAVDGSWENYQLSALLMAIYLNGMNPRETSDLTRAMVNSGDRIDLSEIPGPKVDKHSTGGVGDKTSLILAPLAAACGVIVPMMSGRGLGHTGGTLDKLESIPGFRVDLSEAELKSALHKVGVGMIGQTSRVAPADKTLYSLRDVTGTVESIPLITASILSKKIAEGISGLVLDVKVGSGAFMKTRERAKLLAQSLVRVARESGLQCQALLTPMDTPTGRAVGNALEVRECIETLKGNGPRGLEDLSVCLAARMVKLAGIAKNDIDAEAKVRHALDSGAGLERFRLMVQQQGGDPAIVDDSTRIPIAPNVYHFKAEQTGFIVKLDAEKIGHAAMKLGAGRKKVSDSVDHAVGVYLNVDSGCAIREGDLLYEVHYRNESTLTDALSLLRSSVSIAEDLPSSCPLIYEEIVQ
ncbi:MAG: thymidine phosphorylase [Gemmataceae bacterium]